MRTLIALTVSLVVPGWVVACSGGHASVQATSRNDLDVKGVLDCINQISVPPTDPQYEAEVQKCIAQFDAGVPIPSFDGGLPGLPDVGLPGLPDVGLPGLPDGGVPPIGDAGLGGGGVPIDISFPLPDGGTCHIAFTCQLASCVCDVGAQKGNACNPGQCAQDCRDGC
jgi:hypothetical protein